MANCVGQLSLAAKESGEKISHEEQTTQPQVGVLSIDLLLRIEFLN